MILVNIIDGDPGEVELIGTTTASVGLTATTYEPTSGVHKDMQARAAIVQALTAAINITLNGTTPTTIAGGNKGLTMAANTSRVITGINAIRNLKVIEAVASSGAIVKVEPWF